MGQHQNDITDPDFGQGDVNRATAGPPVGDRGHAAGQRRQHVAGPAHSPPLEGLAPGEHQHDEHPCHILAEDHARHDRDPGQQVGAEPAVQQLDEQIADQWDAAGDQHHHQRQLGEGDRSAGEPAARVERPERDKPVTPARPDERGPGRERHDRAAGDQLVNGNPPAAGAAWVGSLRHEGWSRGSGG